MTRPPVRLLEDQATSPSLRQDLSKVQTTPSSYDTERGLQRLQAAIAAQVTPEQPTDPASHAGNASGSAGASMGTSSSGAALLAKWGVLAALGVGALGVGLFLGLPQPASSPPPEQQVGALPSDEGKGDVPARVTQETEEIGGRGTQPVPPSLRHTEETAGRPSGTRHENRTDHAEEGHRAEIANLQRVRAMLARGQARAAYRTARAGQRRFGQGVLFEEREALTILSLAAMGRQRMATQRARLFIKRFPQSPLRTRVMDAVDPSGGDAAATTDPRKELE